MLADNFILNLDNVRLNSKDSLPILSGIYYVVDRQRVIWYIGRSNNLFRRWNNEQAHHRYEQLLSIAIHENIELIIYYSQEKRNRLHQLERSQIAKYQPRLNNTPIIKEGYVNRKYQQTGIYHDSDRFTVDTPLKILSDIKTYKNMTIEEAAKTQTKAEEKLNSENLPIEQFERKFISLKNNDIGLNVEIEICIDSQCRLFVRHHTFWLIHSGSIANTCDLENKDKVESIIQDLNRCCRCLYQSSLRWLGYKLNCQNVLLIDEEEKIEIETQAIMMPFRMFADLVEYDWMRNSSLSKDLENQGTEWFKNKGLLFKLAKHLHDNNLTFYKLIEPIEQS